MKKKLLIGIIVFSLISIISFYCINKYTISVDLDSYEYNYLPESAKNFIIDEAKKGNKVLTERNKEFGKVYLNPLYVNYLNLTPDKKEKVETIPSVYVYDYVPSKQTNSTYEAKYDLRELGYVSKIKNQGNLGICWSYATIASLESNILKSGFSNTELNFSERQIDYAMSNSLIEVDNPYSLENYSKSLNNYAFISSHELGKGSNFVEAGKYLNLGISPVEESLWNNLNYIYEKMSVADVINTANVNYQVTSYEIYGTLYSMDPTINLSYRNEIKKHIKTYGALYVATLSPSNVSSYCYDAKKNLITDDGSEECRVNGYHAMAIIGWDDSYAEVGAWILKNSWGNDTPYTYLSYDSYFSDIAGITGVKEKNWDNVYDYTKDNTKRYSTNSIEITYKKPALVEDLERISFSTWGINAKYNIYAKNKNSSYKLLKTLEVSNPGMTTIDVSDFSLIDDEFSVKITTTNGVIDDGINVFTSNLNTDNYFEEYTFNESLTNLNKKLFVRNVESGSNLIYYIFNEYGEKLVSNSSYVINGTIDVKENFQFNKGNYLLTFDPNYYEVLLNDSYVELDINELNNYQLNYEISSKLKIKNITFSSSNPDVAVVSDSGLITAVNTGKTFITLNVNDAFILKCEVIVGPIEEILGLDIIEKGGIIYKDVLPMEKLHVNIYPHDANFEEILWSSSNSNVATVLDGEVIFKGTGNVSITASLGALSDTINYNVETSKYISLSQNNIVLKKGENYHIDLPSNFRIVRTKYQSEDPSIAKVSNNGVITAESAGKTWIIINLNNGKSKTACLVNVVDDTISYTLEINDRNKVLNEQGKTFETISIANPSEYKVNITFETNKTGKIDNEIINHTFAGWSFNGDGEFIDGKFTFGYGNGYLLAKWKKQKLFLPDISELDPNANFEGWYSDPKFTKFVGKNIEYVFSNDTTLYAKWNAKPSYKIADVNNDLEIDITDLVILGRYLVGLEHIDDIYLQLADVNNDSEVDITDLVILGRYLVGLEEIN